MQIYKNFIYTTALFYRFQTSSLPYFADFRLLHCLILQMILRRRAAPLRHAFSSIEHYCCSFFTDRLLFTGRPIFFILLLLFAGFPGLEEVVVKVGRELLHVVILEHRPFHGFAVELAERR